MTFTPACLFDHVIRRGGQPVEAPLCTRPSTAAGTTLEASATRLPSRTTARGVRRSRGFFLCPIPADAQRHIYSQTSSL